jgi:predicted O-methyltransferase YrrM
MNHFINIDSLCDRIRNDWKSDSAPLCRRIEAIYRENGIEMTTDPIDQQQYLSALFTIVKLIDARHIIETGTFVGCTTAAMACAMNDLHSDGVIETIDPAPWQYGGFDRKDPVAIAEQVLRQAFSNRVILHRGYSVQTWDESRNELPDVPRGVLAELALQPPKTDFLLIDGDHSYQGAWWDLKIGCRTLRPDGPRLVFVHDYHSISDVRQAVRDWHRRNQPWIVFRAYSKNSGFALMQCHPALIMAERRCPFNQSIKKRN